MATMASVYRWTLVQLQVPPWWFSINGLRGDKSAMM